MATLPNPLPNRRESLVTLAGMSLGLSNVLAAEPSNFIIEENN